MMFYIFIHININILYIYRFIYNTAVISGIFDLFRRWMITNIPADQRVALLIVGFAFGALLEGVAGN